MAVHEHDLGHDVADVAQAIGNMTQAQHVPGVLPAPGVAGARLRGGEGRKALAAQAVQHVDRRDVGKTQGEITTTMSTSTPRRKPVPAKPKYPKSLARSWLEAQQQLVDGTKTDALRRLNEETGNSYNPGRLYQWLAGARAPERETRAYMLRECLAHVLYRHGVKEGSLTPAQLRAIAEELS